MHVDLEQMYTLINMIFVFKYRTWNQCAIQKQSADDINLPLSMLELNNFL